MPLIPTSSEMTDRYKVPDWYAKAARVGKYKYGVDKVAEGLASYGTAAYAGADEENKRGAAQEAYLRDEKAKADKPTITQQEIDRQYGRASDSASGNYNEELAGIREYLGDSGVTGGGMVGGLLANAEIARLRQLTSARSDLMSFKATQDSLDRQRSFDRAQTVASSINRPISMLGIDFENQALQTQQGLLGLEVNRAGAKEMANAQRSASTKGLIGSVAGGLLGLAGA